MDMNKYLIVVIYMVAGCAVAVPMEDIGFSDVSSDIWAEFSELTNTNIILDTQNAPKNSKAAVAAVIMKSENGKILASSLFALNNNTPSNDYSFSKKDDNIFNYRQVLFLEDRNISVIQIRGPGLC